MLLLAHSASAGVEHVALRFSGWLPRGGGDEQTATTVTQPQIAESRLVGPDRIGLWQLDQNPSVAEAAERLGQPDARIPEKTRQCRLEWGDDRLLIRFCVRASVAAPAPQASCAPPSATSLRTVGQVIVYRTVPLGRAHVRSVRACRAGVGDMLLARNGYYEGFGGRRAVAARGNEVAWVKVSRDDGLDGDVPVLDVIARDLGTSEPRLSARSNGSRYVVNDAGIPVSADGVPSIVIAADRSVVWIACDSGSSRDENEHYDRCGVGPRSVWLATDGTSTTQPNNPPPKELARGRTIEARSLRVDASGGVLRGDRTVGFTASRSERGASPTGRCIEACCVDSWCR